MPRPDVYFALLGDLTGSSRALRQLRALAEAGVRVEAVMVGTPRRARALPDGVTLRALPAPAGRGPALFWRAHRVLRADALARPAALYHASDLHVLPALAAAARRHGARLVYDARELYAGLDASAGRPWVGWAWGAVERAFAPRADLVLTVNDAIADRLAARLPIARPVVMHNVAEARPTPPRGALRARLGLTPETPVVLYQGLFRAGRGLLPLVDAMGTVPGAVLVLVGEGPQEEALRRRAARLGDRVRFLPFTPPDELPALTVDADLGAIVARPLTESLRLGLPNKLFEYAAAGLPVLAGAGIEPLRRLVEAYDAGPVADPDDRAALAAALRAGLFDPAARARWKAGAARLHADFSWVRERERFLAAYRPLLA